MSAITYQLLLGNGEQWQYSVDLDRPAPATSQDGVVHPQWTRLGCQQCENCPLDPDTTDFCPAALECGGIAAQFSDSLSIERVDVWVHTPQRSYFKNCDMQQVLRSLFGLVMATGDCPILARFKPMAIHHLPFATLEETVERMVGSYLTSQYFLQHKGDQPDWELKGLQQFYRELRTVNVALMQRMRQASREDANINALQIFVSISSIFSMGVDDIIGRLHSGAQQGA